MMIISTFFSFGMQTYAAIEDRNNPEIIGDWAFTAGGGTPLFGYSYTAPTTYYGTTFYGKDKNGEGRKFAVYYKKTVGPVDTPGDDELLGITIDGSGTLKGAPPGTLKGSQKDKDFINSLVATNGRGLDGYQQYSHVDASAGDINKTRDKAKAAELRPCYSFPFDINVEGCIAEFSYRVLQFLSLGLWAVSWFFNYTLQFSLNMGKFLQDVPIVDIGWKILRDVANLCFIFILLYIAINTILQSKSADTKRLLVRVIIIAIVLNFSLFMTKVVIDTSNILALQFYEKMGGTSTSGPFEKIDDPSGQKGIAQTLLSKLGLESFYGTGNSVSLNNGETRPPTTGNVIAISLGGSLLIMVTAFVLLAAAIMFIVRTIVLIMLMILAPLAFLSMVLPQTEGYWKKWLGTLISQAFFAPLYLMLMYVVLSIISGSYKSKIKTPGGDSLAAFLLGNGSSVGTLYVFVILIGLMFSCLIIAKQLGAYGGDFARNVAGKATFGASGWLGRQTVGRFASIAAKSDFVGKMRNATFDIKNPKTYLAGVARAGAGAVDKTAAGSFDIRASALGGAAASSVGGLGKAGGEGGFKKMSDDDEKRKAEYSKIVTSSAKTAKLEKAIKDNDDTAIQTALYDFSDNEFGELSSSMLKDPKIIRNAKPSQIEHITEEKFEKLGSAEKDDILSKRRVGLQGAAQSIADDGTALSYITNDGTKDLLERLKALPDEAKAKLRTDSRYGSLVSAMELRPDDVAGAQSALNTSAVTADQRKALFSDLKTAHIKTELSKLGTKEKSNMNDFFAKAGNEDVLRNLSSDDMKAIDERKDISPAKKDEVKNKRFGLLVGDVRGGKEKAAIGLLKGARASELTRLISEVGVGNPTLAKIITMEHLKELEKSEFDATQRTALGATIAGTTGANAAKYVAGQRGKDAGWS